MKNNYATIIDMEDEENDSLEIDLIILKDSKETGYDVLDNGVFMIVIEVDAKFYIFVIIDWQVVHF